MGAPYIVVSAVDALEVKNDQICLPSSVIGMSLLSSVTMSVEVRRQKPCSTYMLGTFQRLCSAIFWSHLCYLPGYMGVGQLYWRVFSNTGEVNGVGTGGGSFM